MSPATNPDRYRSFCGLDCDRRATQLLGAVSELIHSREPSNPFWLRFLQRSQGEYAPDPLFMVHAYLCSIRDLLETHQQEQALAWLESIEEECC